MSIFLFKFIVVCDVHEELRESELLTVFDSGFLEGSIMGSLADPARA